MSKTSSVARWGFVTVVKPAAIGRLTQIAQSSVPSETLYCVAKRTLPDLSPDQVVRVQDQLLANADALLSSALAVLELGHVALAQALAILGMEESGKAIAIHDRRVAMPSEPEGSSFMTPSLSKLWLNHHLKLTAAYEFLRKERYWFGTEPADPYENERLLGAVEAWAVRHNELKQRGFYVELDEQGEAEAPTDASSVASLSQTIEFVNQIGWQLRLGEHIEGKQQDQQEAGIPASGFASSSTESPDLEDRGDVRAAVAESRRAGIPGRPLNNAAYRFNPPESDRSPFRNLGKPGYEAETRELKRLHDSRDSNNDGQTLT